MLSRLEAKLGKRLDEITDEDLTPELAADVMGVVMKEDVEEAVSQGLVMVNWVEYGLLSHARAGADVMGVVMKEDVEAAVSHGIVVAALGCFLLEVQKPAIGGGHGMVMKENMEEALSICFHSEQS